MMENKVKLSIEDLRIGNLVYSDEGIVSKINGLVSSEDAGSYPF